MASSGMLRHVALVRTDLSEVLSASFNRITRIGELRHQELATDARCEEIPSEVLIFLGVSSQRALVASYS
jgi:hypothetical protein